MTIRDIPMFRALAAAVCANVPVFLLGNPGQAKSATINALANAWGRHCETVIGSNRDRTDFLGTMIEIDGEVHYSTLGWVRRLNEADSGLLFADELTTTAPDVQKAMLRVIQERYIGDTRLGDHVAIIAAGNPPASAADGYDLEAPVANRFLHLDWVMPAEQWRTGMLEGFDTITYPNLDAMIGARDSYWAAEVKGLIVSFLETQPQWFTKAPPTDPAKAGQAWPSPRSWSMAAAVLAELPHDDVAAQTVVLEGSVGKEARIAFQEWARKLDLPSPKKILTEPDSIGWDRMRPDQAFAALTGLQSYLIGAISADDFDEDMWTNAITAVVAVVDKNRPDLGVQLATWLLNNKPSRRIQMPTSLLDAYGQLFSDINAFAAPKPAMQRLRAV